MNQTTVKTPLEIQGTGLHSGTHCRIVIEPAPPDSGIVFIAGEQEIPALLEEVTETTRGVTLEKGDEKVMTVEHCLSALKGLGIDNARIRVEGEEIPILDGSSFPFVQELRKAGMRELGEKRPFWIYTDKNPYEFKIKDSSYKVEASEYFEIRAVLSYPGFPIDRQNASYRQDGSYEKQISGARTFCLEREVAALQAAGLAKGGSLSNALVVGDNGIQAEGGLRYDNEAARHKVLDLIGDLSLIGMGEFRFRVEASAPGHSSNTALGSELRRLLKKEIL